VAKPVRLRRIASDDVVAAVEFYRGEAGATVAARFVDAFARVVVDIGRHPHQGSLRFSHELGIPELRAWPLARLPYVICYVEHDSDIDVWRLLHTRRDIPAAFTAAD
jgi:toxin ParE1/3/4